MTMRLETLPAGDVTARPANDNASATDKPVVRAPRLRPDATYARSENVILPLRFALRMAGWRDLRLDEGDTLAGS
jgi:hypothetical protein